MRDSLETSFEIIRVSFQKSNPSLTFETSWLAIYIGIVLLIGHLILWKIFSKRIRAKWFVKETTISIKTSVFEYQNKVERSWENLYIANRIYIELITRKAAIPFDQQHDVIKEVYDSWYTLFTSIRLEIKNLPGQFINTRNSSNELIDLTTSILNSGLRPHLTEHQARFRKWYQEQLDMPQNKGKTPQEIQQDYPKYNKLVSSMRDVNETLCVYSFQLKKLINGS